MIYSLCLMVVDNCNLPLIAAVVVLWVQRDLAEAITGLKLLTEEYSDLCQTGLRELYK